MADETKEIIVSHDDLIDNHQKWAAAETSAASDAGTRRQQIGAFAESNQVSGKALSQIRAGLKIKKEGSQLDWLRSMEVMLPMAAAHIRGQGTAEMDFPADNVEEVDFNSDLKDDTAEFNDAVDKAVPDSAA